MANLHTDDRDPLRTTRDTNTTHVRTASARSGGAGWIIALVVLVALAIAAVSLVAMCVYNTTLALLFAGILSFAFILFRFFTVKKEEV